MISQLGPAGDPSRCVSFGITWHRSINRSTLQDLCDANTAVDRLKAEPYLGIKLPHIPTHKVRWVTIQDASRANAVEDHSQGAFLVGATWNNVPSPFALLSQKSHCLKRKCSSTQIMSEASADVEWIRGLFEELTNPVSTSWNGQPSLGAEVSWWVHVHQTLK